MTRILVLENDPHLNGLICDCLNSNGFRAEGYMRPEDEPMAACSIRYELIIANVAFAESNVFEFIQTDRMYGKDTPILYISEKVGLSDQNILFRIGTDDYMDVPIILEELLVRVRAILRRFQGEKGQKISAGNMELDPDCGSVSVDGKIMLLPTIEFQILYKLLSHPRKVLSREQLVAEIWGIDSDANVRLVDTYICKLRRKLSPYNNFKIVSVRTRGYMAVPTMSKCDIPIR